MHPDVVETAKPSPSQLAGCYGKAAYPTKGAALEAERHVKRRKGRMSAGMHPYRCDHCSAWHIGRRSVA